MNIKTLILFLAIVVSACGDNSYQGQAFTEKMGGSQRISNMDIKLVPSASIELNKDKFKSNVDLILVKLVADQVLLEKRINSYEQLKKISISLQDNETILKPIDPSLLKSALSLLETIQISNKSKEVGIQSDFEKLKTAKHPKIFFLTNYTNENLVTKTDADGKFSFKSSVKDLPVVIAGKDDSYWYVNLPEKSDIPLNLTNDNQFETECKDCFFGSEKSKNIQNEISTYALGKINALKAKENINVVNNKYEKLASSAIYLAKKHHQILATIGSLPVRKALSEGLGNTIGGISRRADIRRAELSLEISEIDAREKHAELTKELINKVAELN